MVQRLLVLGLLAESLAAIGLHGEAICAAQPVANTVNPEAIQALNNMRANLQTLKRFQVSVDLTGELTPRPVRKSNRRQVLWSA